ncbi:MAG: hypothetical protein AAFV29_14495, partial [Myxococcota bacterium]
MSSVKKSAPTTAKPNAARKKSKSAPKEKAATKLIKDTAKELKTPTRRGRRAQSRQQKADNETASKLDSLAEALESGEIDEKTAL